MQAQKRVDVYDENKMWDETGSLLPTKVSLVRAIYI